MKNAIIVFFLFIVAITSAQTSLQPIDIDLANYQYPYPVHYIHLDIQGEQLKMAYMDVIPSKPNGQTVVLLHGKNFNGAYWQQTATELAAKGYRIVIPDQIGFGKSSKPKHILYTFQLLAKNTKAILDTLEIHKAVILGHSMGGMVASRFALMYPDIVTKLVLVDPLGLEDWKLKVPYQTVDQWYQTELKQNYDKIKEYQLKNYYHGTWNTTYDQWLNLFAGWTLSPDYPTIAWVSALTYDMIMTQPVLYEFDSIKAPTLLIIGELDRTALGKDQVPADVAKTMGNYPELAKKAEKKIPHCKLVIIPNTGHLPHIESFEKFIKPLEDFLGH